MRRKPTDEAARMIFKRDRMETTEPPRAAHLSTWAPARRALIPIALPQRFVDGVAWDEV